MFSDGSRGEEKRDHWELTVGYLRGTVEPDLPVRHVDLDGMRLVVFLGALTPLSGRRRDGDFNIGCVLCRGEAASEDGLLSLGGVAFIPSWGQNDVQCSQEEETVGKVEDDGSGEMEDEQVRTDPRL